MMKILLKLLTGLMMTSVLALLLMSSRTNAAASLQAGEATPTAQTKGPIVSEPVAPSMSREVKSLPSNEGPYIHPPREINPLQNSQMTPTPQVQAPTVSEPVAPTTSEPVRNLPTAEPYDGSEPIEINPRQNYQEVVTTPVRNREQSEPKDAYGPCGH